MLNVYDLQISVSGMADYTDAFIDTLPRLPLKIASRSPRALEAISRGRRAEPEAKQQRRSNERPLIGHRRFQYIHSDGHLSSNEVYEGLSIYHAFRSSRLARSLTRAGQEP